MSILSTDTFNINPILKTSLSVIGHLFFYKSSIFLLHAENNPSPAT